MAETGNIKKEVTHGILKPPQKPNKAKGPLSNLRPIILLSSPCKILTACKPNRINDRLKVEIPPMQAAYRPNRSTTARSESTHLIMLGTSKGFDSINRNQLIADLRSTIETDELHIISTLLNVLLSVRCENTLSKIFETDTSGPQGDCASALHFTYYLGKTLKPARSNQLADHPYAEQNVGSSIPNHITEHNYCVINHKDQIDIDMKYAVTLAR